jgi:GMP reductase
MNKINNNVALDFQDVLIVPKRTSLASRSQVSLERTIKSPEFQWTGVPIMASNMDTVGTFEVYDVLSKHKILTAFHKFYTVQDYIRRSDTLDPNYFAVSIGIRDEDIEKLRQLVNLMTLKFVVIDIANGHMERLFEVCKHVNNIIPRDVILIAGNVTCPEVARRLVVEGGVSIVKCGIGSGSACLTRSKAGVGIPQFTATMECAEAVHSVGGFLMSDGGITCPGDVSKAFGIGADFVMIGGQFAGHDENPGEIEMLENGARVKVFYGMSSETAMYRHYGEKAKYRSSEGRTLKIPYRGSLHNTVEDYLGGIRSTCTYVDARNLEELVNNATFRRVNNQLNKFFVK